MKSPVCPKCGRRAYTAKTSYGPRHACCGLWSWDGAPLVDAATHEARKAAHAAFDRLWKDGILSRSQAYRELAKALGLKPEDCHMKLMDAQTAGRVPGIAASLRTKFDDDAQVIE